MIPSIIFFGVFDINTSIFLFCIPILFCFKFLNLSPVFFPFCCYSVWEKVPSKVSNFISILLSKVFNSNSILSTINFARKIKATSGGGSHKTKDKHPDLFDSCFLNYLVLATRIPEFSDKDYWILVTKIAEFWRQGHLLSLHANRSLLG